MVSQLLAAAKKRKKEVFNLPVVSTWGIQVTIYMNIQVQRVSVIFECWPLLCRNEGITTAGKVIVGVRSIIININIISHQVPSLLSAVVSAAPPLFITNINTNTVEADTKTKNTETSSSLSSVGLIRSEDVITIDSDSGENQTERWEENPIGNDLEETSTEEYDAIIEIYAMMDNEMNLLEDEENKSSGTTPDETTTTKNMEIVKYSKSSAESKKTDDDLTKTSTTTISVSEVTDNSEITFPTTTTTSKTRTNTASSTTTTATATTITTTTSSTTDTSNMLNIKEEENIRADERSSLISELGPIDFTKTDLDSLVLTPRQRLAVRQELEYQQLGLPPFSDPSPWQRLSREQQEEFNQKYLSLSPELQEFSKSQFLKISERAQKQAYNAFLNLDSNSLAVVIEREMKIIKSREFPEHQVTNNLSEEFRSSNGGVRVNNFDFPDVAGKPQRKQNKTVRKYTARRRRRPHLKVKPAKPRQLSEVTQSTARAQELHLKFAREQLLQAIHLQACLSQPATCGRLNHRK